MKYVGIDLGTTNSAICSYDGETLRLYKSPEQHDVTPSAIFFDRRGNKYVGSRAYNNAARNPDNAATLFKRFMGTNMPIKLSAVGKTLSPEECSAEVLRVLFGYLPEEVRTENGTGTVITVPAAFNQMQKDATRAAALTAGIGTVALMQEPVAAVMSAMRERRSDGVFLVYDLGGGTLDIAVAESVGGSVSLLAHGGIAVCGGRDFDRLLVSNVVKPWLLENFDLPEDLRSRPEFKVLMRMATLAAERAKIELCQRPEVTIGLPETELGVRDLSGEEIYLDVEVTRDEFNRLIWEKLAASIEAARETLEKSHVNAHDVDQIVFVGGPTQYKPLRDRVSTELGIAASTELNPMTAVAEGAALFAESVDWSSKDRARKSSRGMLSAAGTLASASFHFVARTPESKARLVVRLERPAPPGAEFQVDSLDSGWSSGRVALENEAGVTLPLVKPGENTFKVFIFDSSGGLIPLGEDRIEVSRTAATVDAIPASHSVGVEVRDRIGGRAVLDPLVKQGDPLPKKGRRVFRSEESLKAGSPGSIRFKIWEGESSDPISDNRFVGTFEVRGTDFIEGVIPAGAELICHYEILDSGNLVMEVEVPSIQGSFGGGRNFYTRQAAQVDYSEAGRLVTEQAEHVRERIEQIESNVRDERLEKAKKNLRLAGDKVEEGDAESAAEASQALDNAKRLLSATRRDHLSAIRRVELDHVRRFYEESVREHARPSERTSIANLFTTAERAVDEPRGDFESHLADLRGRAFAILWRQDWFIVERFRWLAASGHLFPDSGQHKDLVSRGLEAMQASDLDKLREVVLQLDGCRLGTGGDEDMFADINILRG